MNNYNNIVNFENSGSQYLIRWLKGYIQAKDN